MVAAEFGVCALVERGFRSQHILLWSDNQGVIGALDACRSRGVHANRVLQRIVVTMLEHELWVSTRYVKSADNPADAPSRGLPAVDLVRERFAFKIPFVLREYVDKV